MEYKVRRFVTGPIETNTYVIYNEEKKTCLIIDPSRSLGEVLKFVSDNELKLQAIALTHGHFDHLLGIPEVLSVFPGTEVYAHPDETPLITNEDYNGSSMLGIRFAYTGTLKALNEGDTVVGDFNFCVKHIPGHSPGGVSLVFGKNCISGDSLFAGSIGRSDFPGGNHELLIKNIREKLLTLPDDTVVWPGHGGRTSIAREKKFNPYFI